MDGIKTAWELKAEKLIAQYCQQAYLAANTSKSGKRYKKHHPYSTPAIAQALVEALRIRDERAREIEIKRLFEIERAGAWTLI